MLDLTTMRIIFLAINTWGQVLILELSYGDIALLLFPYSLTFFTPYLHLNSEHSGNLSILFTISFFCSPGRLFSY